VNGVNATGSITVFAARKAFPTRFWHQAVAGIPGDVDAGDGFGVSLSHR
jgi:hypothetical protein